MKKVLCILFCLMISSYLFPMPKSETGAQSVPETQNQEVLMNKYGLACDIFDVGGNTLSIFFVSHGTLMLEYNGKFIHIDPVSMGKNYDDLPDGDLILLTHGHPDHLDAKVLKKIIKDDSIIIGTEECINVTKQGTVLKNGEQETALGITIRAVPAYNTTAGRDKFHPKGRDNGYILDFKGKRVYIAGDTEDTPEMLALKGIDIAFLPMNQPYTMTPEQVARAVRGFKPKILYPYHYGDTDTEKLLALLKDETNIEVRIRDLK